jgi:hypothetical protein
MIFLGSITKTVLRERRGETTVARRERRGETTVARRERVWSPNGEGDALRVDVGRIDGIQHIVEGRDATIVIGDLSKRGKNKRGGGGGTGTHDGELNVGWGSFGAELVDIVDPCFVRAEVVSRETNDLDVTSGKFGGTTGDFSKLGGANL